VGSSASSQKAVLLDEGDFLRIGYEGTWIVLRSLKGFVYLQYLLLHPDEKVHVSRLAALDGRADPHEGSRADPPSGDILDPRARREYRARLLELRAELDEAVHWADLERADSIRREIDSLTVQLARAFDRSGRARKMSDPIERVRKAVTKRIHDAIDRIAKQNPYLGRHLHNAIRTGYFCWYSPEFPVTWTSEPPPPLGTPS
jgi:pimeloyl-ACP methyl ester carboxylesterase